MHEYMNKKRAMPGEGQPGEGMVRWGIGRVCGIGFKSIPFPFSIQFHVLSTFLVTGTGLGVDREIGQIGDLQKFSLSGIGASSRVS